MNFFVFLITNSSNYLPILFILYNIKLLSQTENGISGAKNSNELPIHTLYRRCHPSMRKLLSYFFPVKVREYASQINGRLEINLVNGRKILDSKTTNYSYGALQAVLKTGLRKIGLNNTVSSVLVLGMGGGSIVETIRNDFSSHAFIELVDIDPAVIAIASSEFGIDRYTGISLVQSDAWVFMKNCTMFYDIIVVDLFVIDTIPHTFTTVDFIQILNEHLNPAGSILYNTMRQTMGRTTFENLKSGFEELQFKVTVLERVGEVNDLIIAKKPV